MDFDPEHNPYEEEEEDEEGGGGVAFNGGGGEPVEEEQQNHRHPPDHGGLEPFDSVDRAEIEIKHSFDHRDSSSGKLFVGGISWETTEETFNDYFSKYGEITDSVIMTDKYSGRPRGFGFVTFADPAVTDKVLVEEHVIDGRAVEVKKTVPREDMQQGKGVSKTKKIFIGGIPPSLSEDDLKEYFSTYGIIVEHQIMLDHKTGRSRGFGFVTFESEEPVENIFSERKEHELGGKLVEIKKAEPKRSGDFGGSAKSYGGFSGGSGRYGGNSNSAASYGGKMGRGYGDYGAYGAYGAYGGNFGGASAGFYGGFGGYGYGYGFGGPMYGGAGYGGGGYGNPAGYGVGADYGGGGGGGGRAYGGGGGGGYGGGSSGGGAYGGSVYGGGGGGYGGGGSGGGRGGYGGGGGGGGGGGSGGYDSGKGYGGGGGNATSGRYHPYRK